jgi:hypothetical protein
VTIPSWNDIFTKFNNGDYPKSTPHSKLQLREVDDAVFPTIKRSMLHYVVVRAPIMPSVELMEWVISRTKAQDYKTMNDKGECIGSFLPQDTTFFYKLPNLNESLTKDFMIAFYE